MATIGRSPGEEALAGLSSEALEAFEREFHGELLFPQDAGYGEARTVWNGMIDSYPAIIARCSGVADVITAVTFGREYDLPVAVRGGGHNVAGTAVQDGGIVVDLSAMNGVRVDPEARTVRAEGGATLGDVDRETQLFGLATALGAVSQTGIAGLTLNGGYGHLSRQYGLSLDNLRSVDIVTADGTVRTASAEENTDLFWAVRGGGGNFGVVTSFEYALHEVGPEVYTLFVWFHAEDSKEAMDRYREWIATAPREAGVLAFAAHVPDLEEFPEEHWGEPTVAMLGSYRGDSDDARAVFEALGEGLTPLVDFSGPMAYTELQSMLDEDYPDGLRYYWKSVYLSAVTDEVVDLLLRYNESTPSPLSTVDLWHLDGAVSEIPRDATAFWHRDKPYMITFEANWEDPADDDANVDWAREGIAETQDLSVASGRYGNFPGMNEDPTRALFGDNYERLVEIKSRYDPENLFRSNANVAPRPSAP
ncbi:glycolate oxidase subunit GlcD [Halalkalicoccus paucihalophilus]|uniref:Glycolate oxidase subunit GlcD n=1 Tax=Halalkalicoccus paucihalophilus TaxID=1008153 RepID=A0A151AJU7_9EURY|nr:FAD-binding oxidoreductase [Halalkalicoccus paucihalophilus]KYH27835.1 glycolate oxidase subunit GlcD [Halalkalicoccus paucihalophilus]